MTRGRKNFVAESGVGFRGSELPMPIHPSRSFLFEKSLLSSLNIAVILHLNPPRDYTCYLLVVASFSSCSIIYSIFRVPNLQQFYFLRLIKRTSSLQHPIEEALQATANHSYGIPEWKWQWSYSYNLGMRFAFLHLRSSSLLMCPIRNYGYSNHVRNNGSSRGCFQWFSIP
jgi:hypothetical protein